MDNNDENNDALGAAYAGAMATKDAAVLFAETAVAGARNTNEALRRQIVASPYATLSVAAGVGFIVAGGLSAPALWGVARVGARVALANVARQVTAALLEVEAKPDTNAEEASSSPPKPEKPDDTVARQRRSAASGPTGEAAKVSGASSRPESAFEPSKASAPSATANGDDAAGAGQTSASPRRTAPRT